MKRLLLMFTMLLMALFTHAQSYTCDSLIINVTKPIENILIRKPFSVEMRDGSQLTCMPLQKVIGSGTGTYLDYGCWFYKIAPQDIFVIDSALLRTNNQGFCLDEQHLLMCQDHRDGGYILAKLIYNQLNSLGDSGNTWLHISRFDDDMNFYYEDAVMVPLEDTIVKKLTSIEFDGENIMLMYVKDQVTPVVARIGLDGTIHEKVDFDGWFATSRWFTHGFGIFNDTPRKYAIFDWDVVEGDTCAVYHVLDSLLNPMEDIVMDGHFGDIYPVKPGCPHEYSFITKFDMLSLDDNAFVEVFQYECHNMNRNGVCVMKFDKATHSSLANAQFESWPYYSNPIMMGYPFGIKKSADGNLYLAYRTNAHQTNWRGWIGVAKLDTDLNVIWQRYCLGSWSTTTGYDHRYCGMDLTATGFVVNGIEKIGGVGNYDMFHIFINDNDINGTPEMEAFVRPYAYWPNPTQDQLYLQYSPDVKPIQIELYDLQGRLVCSQTEGLENIDMQSLGAGQYLMKVMLEDGKVFTDKVLKE